MSTEHDDARPTAGGAAAGPGPDDRPRPAEEVEVWCASLHRWVEGFGLVDRTVEGCLIRRLSDGELLPLAFSDEHVRPRPDTTGTRQGPLRPSTARGAR